jgi:hypothetical protein
LEDNLIPQIFKVGEWGWRKLYMPPHVAEKRNNIITVLGLKLINKNLDPLTLKNNSIVLITGDGNTLSKEVREFESWNIPHDLYAVNRSLLFHQRQVDHWAAIDIEESCWFAQNVTFAQQPNKNIKRHTIGECSMAYDIYWEMDYPWENDFQRRVFVGNSGYFAVLTAIHIGYEKIILAGMPLNTESHWYETDKEKGPNWRGLTYIQWMDFKMKSPNAEKVKSLGGYSAFILGIATKDWINGS